MLLLGVFTFFMQALSQERTITGRVTDSQGNPVPLASVTVKGTNIGTSTNSNGEFTLSIPASAKTLVVSSVGLTESEMDIDTRSSYEITLSTAAVDLEGVVITGYTRVKKSEYVGAASKIDKSQIELVPVGSFDQILQGRAPGLRVSAGSGQPGAAASVQIRGPKSIAGGSDPLYVIDGIPVEASVFQSYNPNDFETVDVIKDASAAALYGSSGASGVIVITTKKGRPGQTRITYRPQLGISQAGSQPFNMMNTTEILQFQENLGKFIPGINLPGWRYSPNNPANASLSQAQKDENARILDSLRGINTDWQDIFQRRGTFQSHDFSISGGNERTQFYTSLGYYNEDGIGERSNLERYTVRLNLSHTADRLTAQFNSTLGYSNRDFIESENGIALANPFAAAYLALPYHKLFKEDGAVDVGSGKVGPNAYQRIRDIERYNNQMKATVSLNLNYDITKNIYIGTTLGGDFRETNNVTYLKPNTFTTSTAGFPTNFNQSGSYTENFGRNFQGNTRGFIGFRKDFDEIHNVDVTFFTEYFFNRSKDLGITAYNLNTKLFNTPAAIPLGQPAQIELYNRVNGGRSERATVSYLGTLKYSFADKYFLDFTARRDGTSILPEVNRYQNFFAAGLLWNVLKEGFTQNWNAFSTLRIRASYGSSANAQNFPFGDFGYLPLYGAGNYGGLTTLAPTTVGNPVADWEYTDKANLGFEFGLMKERLYGEVNLYNEITRNLFIEQQIPAENGGAFLAADVNAGNMRNRGVELNLTYNILRPRSGLNWSVSGNVAYNDNEITSLGDEEEFEQGTSIIRVGLPLGSHYSVKWAGVDAATGDPLYYDADGKITSQFPDAQVAEFGTFYAPWTGGFNTSLRYKGIEVGAFFNFQAKFSRFNNQDFFQLNHAFALQGFNLRKEMLTMWSQPGDVTNIQKPTTQRQFSSKDIQDASYLRFRNLQVAYSLPATILNKIKYVQAFRLYAQAQNLYTWTKWTGFDPEDDNNIAGYEYPLPRIFTIGVDITF